ncbi:MAG: class I SAM-dependent methyltransferase [Microthrixaceae bacterium]|nr:class I SAM-dependent methyltransferase [Microthrixaceae bacterium]
MKLTGERPMQGQTPDSLLALHAAGYREVLDRVGTGRMLDLGCGLADGTITFASPDRMLVGVDYDQPTAANAVAMHPGVDLTTVCSDGAKLPIKTGSFDDVCSSHLIEHFVDPEFHVSEVARVLDDQGRAFFLTPNKPADFENPFHVYLFEPDDLRAMLGRHFDSVEVLGLDATPIVKADFEKRRNMANKLLKLDPFGLRHKLPRKAFVWLHETGRRVAYRFTNTEQVGGTSGITADDFFTTPEIDPSTLVLLAVATRPKR